MPTDTRTHRITVSAERAEEIQKALRACNCPDAEFQRGISLALGSHAVCMKCNAPVQPDPLIIEIPLDPQPERTSRSKDVVWKYLSGGYGWCTDDDRLHRIGPGDIVEVVVCSGIKEEALLGTYIHRPTITNVLRVFKDDDGVWKAECECEAEGREKPKHKRLGDAISMLDKRGAKALSKDLKGKIGDDND